MSFQDLPERIGQEVSGLRDRTAEAVRADSDSFFRAVSKLGDRFDDLEETLTDRLDRLSRLTEANADALERVGSKRTTWPRRLFWAFLGGSIAAAVAYLADPERGRARRARLSDQVASRARKVGGEVFQEAKVAADRARGTVIEAAKDLLPDDVPDDPDLLEQRIRSEVFGHRDDTADVVLRVDGPGVVALKGTVPTRDSEDELVRSVGAVDGVTDVTSELEVRAGH